MSIESRRLFLRRALAASAAFPFLLNCGTDSNAQSGAAGELALIKKNAMPPGTEWAGAIDAPERLSWQTATKGGSGEGEPLIITGTIFQPDGATPAPSVLVYFYHTDAAGFYGRHGEHRHGRFRGWMLTDERGRYEFRTIRPASYPNRPTSAHIHMTLTGSDFREDYPDVITFEGDPFITDRERAATGRRGGFNPIIRLEKDSAGVLRGRRDIRLWQT